MLSAALQRIKIVFGIVLLVLGLLGMLLPIIPGAPIMLAGFALLGSDHPLVRQLKTRLESWRQRWRQRGNSHGG